jgi:hypothetical protein
MRELRLLWYVMDLHDISLQPVYIRSAENKLADWASRLAAPGDYLAAPDVFALAQRNAAFTVDAFASAATAQVPRYWTESREPGAEATDAFTQVWAGEHLWLHPPVRHLPQCARRLRLEPAVSAAVLTPRWRGASWYTELMGLASSFVDLPPGSLLPIAADAPQRLRSWPVTLFWVPARSRG